MTATIGTSGGNKTVGTITVGTASGNKTVEQGWIGTAGGNKLFYEQMTAEITPSSMNWLFTGSDYISELQFLANPVGGVTPYTYAWEVTGDASIDTPTAFNTGFTSLTGDLQQARCLVTDNYGSTAYTPYGTISV